MRLSKPRREPRIYGHRGSRLREPDNTIASFRRALEEGAHGFETDVRQLADETVVLFHAEFVDGRPTSSLGVRDLEALHPDLAYPSDLASIAADREVILEIKDRGCEAALVEQIRDLSSAILCSFDHRTVRELVRIRESASANFLVGVVVAGRLIDGARYVSDLGADWFLPASSFIDEETLAEFVDLDIPVVPWVLNHPFQWKSAVEWGCHGFITDDPLEASRWRVPRTR